jgi:hypothetical protein
MHTVKTRSLANWRYVLGCGLILLVLLAALTRWITVGSPSTPVVAVTIDARRTLGIIPPAAFGLNATVWDNHLLDAAVPPLLHQADASLLRYPGGRAADNYHWASNTLSDGGYTNPRDTFDAFMSVARRSAAEPLITVNYGSNLAGTGGGNPFEAAAWVYYANVVRGYGVRYWEIGNEVFGNGTYSNRWETDLHLRKGPAVYASNVLAYAAKMKAADPSIKIGVALTTPGYWPDGQVPDWNRIVLARACAAINFVDVHWYPGSANGADATLLDSTSKIASAMETLRSEIADSCGAHAGRIQIYLGEMNTGNVGKQLVSPVNALFLADSFMTWLENGAANASWWDLHNGINRSGNYAPSLYGDAAYGDLGILADGTCARDLCEPAADTPFPPYYGLRMLAHLGGPGDRMVIASTGLHAVAAHAVYQANGDLAVLLVNKSPTVRYDATVRLAGFAPASQARVYTYAPGPTATAAIEAGARSDIGRTFTQHLPPYSLIVLVLQPGATQATPLTAIVTQTGK